VGEEKIALLHLQQSTPPLSHRERMQPSVGSAAAVRVRGGAVSLFYEVQH